MTAIIVANDGEEGIAIGTGGAAFTMPSPIVAGNLLLAIGTKRNGTGLSSNANWTELDDTEAGSAACILALFARIATGVPADDAFTMAGQASGNDDYAAEILVIDDHGVTDVTSDIPFAALAEVTITPDPPSLDTGASDDYLFITACSYSVGAAGQNITDDPSGYSQVVYRKSADNSGGVFLWVAERSATTQVENPGTFTTTQSRQVVTYTIAIPPLAVADPKTVTDDDPIGITDSVVIQSGAEAVFDAVGITEDQALAVEKFYDNPADVLGIVDFVTTELNTTVEFPIEELNDGAFGSGNTWPDDVPTPTGIGHLCLYHVLVDNPLSVGITGSAGWTKRADVVVTGQVLQYALFARILDGGANDTLTLTLANSQDYVAWYNTYSRHGVININTDLFVATPASNATPSLTDPPNLDTGAVRRYKWVAVGGIDTDSTTTMNNVPTGFTTVHTQRSSSQGGSCILSIADRNVEIQALDPTTFNHPVQEWAAVTIAIPPGYVEFLPEPIDLIGITDTVTVVVTPSQLETRSRIDPIGITDVMFLSLSEQHRRPWPQAR